MLIGSPQRLCELIGLCRMLEKVQGQFALVDFLLAAFPTKLWCVRGFYRVVTHCHHRGARWMLSLFSSSAEVLRKSSWTIECKICPAGNSWKMWRAKSQWKFWVKSSTLFICPQLCWRGKPSAVWQKGAFKMKNLSVSFNLSVLLFSVGWMRARQIQNTQMENVRRYSL